MSKVEPYLTTRSCWSCEGELEDLFELPEMPLTGRFPSQGEEHLVGDITLSICSHCKLLQLKQAYSPSVMYEQYFYQSSVNNTMRNHLLNLISKILSHVGPIEPANWLDIGCNDGYLLSIIRSLGWNTFGVDPSDIIGSYLLDTFGENIESSKTTFINDIFPSNARHSLGSQQFDVITSISMFYDVSNIGEFVKEIDLLLSPKGTWIVEMNYTYDMAIENGYDMISHEHITYFTVSTFIKMLNKYSNTLKLVNVEKTPINGGSITLYVSRDAESNDEVINSFIEAENSAGIHDSSFWSKYFENILNHSNKVSDYINNEIAQGKVVGIYGASTRGNTNLILSKIDSRQIEYAFEKNEKKIGRLCPGSRIQIVHEDKININLVQTLIVMPYSFIDEFVEKERKFLDQGGKLVTLVPHIREYFR